MLRSTFLGYKTATSALKVNQNHMDVTGQNISNINTKGYTRQRLDISSLSFNTSNMKFGSTGVVIGQGVEANGVSQFRDAFLDLRYRIEAAKSGSEYVQLEALSDLESVFDEISMDKLDAQFSDLAVQLHSLTSSPSDPVMEGVVRTSAEMLTQMLNDYSRDIETIYEQQLSYLENGAVQKINELTKNIAKLNQQIKESNISDNPALELNDERNMLIDELSNYIDIEVDIIPLPIGGGKTIDELVIRLSGEDYELVNRNNGNSIDIKEDDLIKIELTDLTDTLDITNSIKGGQIDGYLKFLNGKGEFATAADTVIYEKAAEVKGVQYYSNMIDTLAKQFATVMNTLNTTASGVNKPLFQNRDGIDITAGNIKIHDDWASSTESYIVNTTGTLPGDDTGATDNILRMINAFNTDKTFSTGSVDLFKGTFQEFLSYTTTKLNLQTADVQISYDTYSETQFHIDYARSSMSSVDLNEEGVNLLQYSKSYNAAARLMTTLDEMLETLINRMGV
ncbi:MAG: flagellar hook-associated protein FlgK [Tissierellia bacterium]|nr:flagellar hook-associated protein FlgK [Tissierellia bacterium]MDD4437021.1 flagellar hook-associated protein FlgK [Tissierellia bacterium]